MGLSQRARHSAPPNESRRRAGLRQYRSREGLRKRSSLGRTPAIPIGSICRRRLRRTWNPCKGRTCPAGPSVIDARLPLDRLEVQGLTKPIPYRWPLARDGPPGQGFTATGLAAALHQQVAISMAEAGARRRRPAPSESFSVSLGMKRLCRLYDALRCREIETCKTRGADSGIGDLWREFGWILELHPPLAPKTLACTDWVAFHYI